MRRIHSRSAPAQKLGPRALRMTTRAEGWAPTRRSAAARSATIASSKALWRSARSSVTRATPSSATATCTAGRLTPSPYPGGGGTPSRW